MPMPSSAHCIMLSSSGAAKGRRDNNITQYMPGAGLLGWED